MIVMAPTAEGPTSTCPSSAARRSSRTACTGALSPSPKGQSLIRENPPIRNKSLQKELPYEENSLYRPSLDFAGFSVRGTPGTQLAITVPETSEVRRWARATMPATQTRSRQRGML